jgi:hypothetical protein
MKVELKGKDAFYNKGNYEETFREEIAKIEPPPNPIYTYGDVNFLTRFADVFKVVGYIIIFPIGICKVVHLIAHRIIGKIISQANYWSDRKLLAKEIDMKRFGNFKVKRVSFKIYGKLIDAVIFVDPKNLENRWRVRYFGNGGSIEMVLNEFLYEINAEENLKVFNAFKSNLVLFNYPKVCSSEGPFTRESIKDACRGIVKYLEEEVKTTKIIHDTASLGGMALADALKGYKFKEGVKHLIINKQTARSMGWIVSSIFPAFLFINRIAQFFIFIFGWNMDTVKTFKDLECEEIVVQRTDKNGEVEFDGMFTKEVAYWTGLKEKKSEWKGKKYFIPTRGSHGNPYADDTFTKVIKKVNEIFGRDNSEVKKAV